MNILIFLETLDCHIHLKGLGAWMEAKLSV
jgi:hypothetical protein